LKKSTKTFACFGARPSWLARQRTSRSFLFRISKKKYFLTSLGLAHA
jgi:hypothetical protein